MSGDRLGELVTSTLKMLEPYADEPISDQERDEPLLSLLNQCEMHCEALSKAPVEPVRTIHHFACTGGTIMCRAIAAQPNAVVLSEIDPLSAIGKNAGNFSPQDIIGHARAGMRGASDATATKTFLASLKALYEEMTQIGRHLVLRDHTHSHFCTAVDPASRPSVRQMLNDSFRLRSIVTVRHPLDSYLSLIKMGWVHFAPATLQEYSIRYRRFLDEYAGLRIFRYEDFTESPDSEVEEMTGQLELPYYADWQSLLPLIELSGDSGRKSDEIASRPRRPVPENIGAETFRNAAYDAICDRLEYDPDPTAPPLK